MIGLSFLRKLHNLTMKELGESIGVTRQSINIWEKSKSTIPYYRIKQFAYIFQVDVEYISKNLSNKDMEYLVNLKVNKTA